MLDQQIFPGHCTSCLPPSVFEQEQTSDMNPKPSRTPFLMIAVIFSLAAATFSGCATQGIAPGPDLEPAGIPQYLAGTTFVYANGTWETVIAATPDKVTWKNHRGYISAGSPDFTYRRSEWQTRKRQGNRHFSPRTDISYPPATSLWPLAAEKGAAFRENGQWRETQGPEKTYTSIWSCEVQGTERVSVLAGEFDTWKIVCKRYAANRYGSASKVKEVKTWYYAPEVNHPVLTTWRYTYARPSKSVELMAVLPPENEFPSAASARMKLSLQKSLESNKRGKAVRWEVPSQGLAGQTVPLDTFQLENSVFCRRFVQEVRLVEEKRNYYGMACRNPDGRWVVPRR